MLVRVGNTEAEVKVAAVMSMPRLGFTDNFFCVASALAPHGISPVKVTGAYWGQSLQMAIESVIEDADWVLTIDYDTIFSAKTVEALLTLAMWSGVDAIAPLQVKREANAVMFALAGSTPDEQTQVGDDWFKKPVQPVETSHFGLTFLRASALKATPLRQKVARELPGCVFAPAVRYVSVAGAVDLDPARGEASDTARRMAPTAYRNSSGDANDRGDGLVPLSSALLEGAEPVVLEGVAHGGAFGPRWYGSGDVVERWWAALSGGLA